MFQCRYFRIEYESANKLRFQSCKKEGSEQGCICIGHRILEAPPIPQGCCQCLAKSKSPHPLMSYVALMQLIIFYLYDALLLISRYFSYHIIVIIPYHQAIEELKDIDEVQPVDIFVLLILHSCDEQKKAVENVVRNKVTSGVVTSANMKEAFSIRPEVCFEPQVFEEV